MTLRVAIVGAGVMGLSTAWALARAGHTVAVYEQGPVPNPLGSSVDGHRLIRHSYGAEVGYTRMVDAAYAAWDELWRDLGTSLHRPTGTLVLDAPGTDWAAATRATLDTVGIAYEALTPADVAARWPLFETAGLTGALWLESGGVLMAGDIVAALAQHLRARGVAIHPHARITALDPERGTLVLDGVRGIDADAVVVAAGPWTARLLPEPAARAVASRQVVAYVAPPDELAEAWATAPMVVDIDPERGFYTVPPVGGARMNLGDHTFTLSGDPGVDRDATAAEAKAAHDLARRRFAGGDRFRLLEAKTCFYTVSPDERFVAERLGARGWVLAGFSGHGFKFGAVMGQRVAAAVAGELDAAALAAWAAGRATTPAP